MGKRGCFINNYLYNMKLISLGGWNWQSINEIYYFVYNMLPLLEFNPMTLSFIIHGELIYTYVLIKNLTIKYARTLT